MKFDQQWKFFKLCLRVKSRIIVGSKEQIFSIYVVIMSRGKPVWHEIINTGGSFKNSYLIDAGGTVEDVVKMYKKDNVKR